MADNPSSFAMGFVVGLGEGTELPTPSVMCLLVLPAVGAYVLFVLAEILAMASVWLLTKRRHPEILLDCSTRSRNQSCSRRFVSYKPT